VLGKVSFKLLVGTSTQLGICQLVLFLVLQAGNLAKLGDYIFVTLCLATFFYLLRVGKKNREENVDTVGAMTFIGTSTFFS